MKIANIDRQILHIFWTTWGILTKFSGKMSLKIILNVTKNQSFTFFHPPPRPSPKHYNIEALFLEKYIRKWHKNIFTVPTAGKKIYRKNL